MKRLLAVALLLAVAFTPACKKGGRPSSAQGASSGPAVQASGEITILYWGSPG